MEHNSNVKPTNEETNNLISLCEAIRDNKSKQFKKCLKKTSHRPEFLLKQSVTIKAQKTGPLQNNKISGDSLFFAINYSRNEMQQELINNGANFADTLKHLVQEQPVTIIRGDSGTIETTRAFVLKAAKMILELVNKNEHEKLKFLLEGAQVNKKFSSIINANMDEPFFNFLIQAAYFNFPRMIEVLCEAGINVNYATPDKKITALHMACVKGSLECVKILLKYGANINAKSSKGQTPLYTACVYGYDEIVQYLCSEKADTTISDINCSNPLHIAVKGNKTKCVEILIKYFSELEIEDESKLTPLYLAIKYQHENLVEYLLEKKADPNYSSNINFTPLSMAANLGNLAIVKTLIKYGVDINLGTAKGNITPLSTACYGGHLDIVEFLLDTKKIVIEKNNSGKNQSCLISALFMEDKTNQISIMDKLCQYGFDPLQKDTIVGIPVLLYALKEKNEEVLYLLAYYISKNFLEGKSEINFNNCRITNAQFDYPIDNDGPLLILELLYKINYLQAAKIFILNGANGDIPTPDGKYESINEWIRLSADPNHVRQALHEPSPDKFDFYQTFGSDANPANSNIVSGLKYLQLNGFTPDEIATLKKSSKQVETNKQMFFKADLDKKFHHWCEMLFTSSDRDVHPVTGTPNCYLYIATDNLTDCPKEFFERLDELDFKFNSAIVKKLKIAESEINVSFRLIINQQPYETELTHEIKFPQSKARILLFELMDKPTGATLYIAAKYLKNGLHTKADLESLKQSSTVIFLNRFGEKNNTNVVSEKKLSM